MNGPVHAAVVTVGTELTEGLRYDTNSRDVARALAEAGCIVDELVSLPDDADAAAAALTRLLGAHGLVIVTGGLGPTHDDITREAASRAVGRPLVRDEALVPPLLAAARRHLEPAAAGRLLGQADVIEGATSINPTVGTAPGMIIHTGIRPGGSTLVLLPGPPREMRPMLTAFLAGGGGIPGVRPLTLRCFGLTESDAQARIEPVLAGYPGIVLTLLAGLDGLDVILLSRGAEAARLAEAGACVREVLGRDCYSTDGSSLAETVLRLARERGLHLATAESCTGGLVSAALTDVPGSSDAFAGGVVSYSNELKAAALGVPHAMLAMYGAVSAEVAVAMAEGALELPGVDVAVAVTGIAGPDGGSIEKPVGTVWFALATADGHRLAVMRTFPGDRPAVRTRASATALDLIRRLLEERYPCAPSSL